jgi:hypothetical protein
LGKKQLNKGKMTDIRTAVFQIYPLGVEEKEGSHVLQQLMSLAGN